MPHLRYTPVYPVILTYCFMAGCASAHKLPTILPVPMEYYPPAARRLGEEGRVLVEFHLDEHRRPLQLTIDQTDPSLRIENSAFRLNEGALRVIKGMQFEPSDHTQTNPKRTYRITVIFCLQPGNCERISPFPHTESVVVKGTPISSEQILDLKSLSN